VSADAIAIELVYDQNGLDEPRIRRDNNEDETLLRLGSVEVNEEVKDTLSA